MAELEVKGYLVITIIEASGKNKDENYTWDSTNFEGFVKGERGAWITQAGAAGRQQRS